MKSPTRNHLRRVEPGSTRRRSEWTHERVGRILAGVGVILFGLLAMLHQPAWLAGVLFIGVNLTQSGVTNRCGVKSLLIRLGLPGERDLGRTDGQPSVRVASSLAPVCPPLALRALGREVSGS